FNPLRIVLLLPRDKLSFIMCNSKILMADILVSWLIPLTLVFSPFSLAVSCSINSYTSHCCISTHTHTHTQTTAHTHRATHTHTDPHTHARRTLRTHTDHCSHTQTSVHTHRPLLTHTAYVSSTRLLQVK